MGFLDKLVSSFSSDNAASSVDPNGFRVAGGSDKVVRFIKYLMETHGDVTVSLGANNPSSRTMIIAFDPQTGTLTLDEAVPKQDIRRNNTLVVEATSKGLEVKFKGKVLETGSEQGARFYKMEFPAELRYREDRRNNRYLVGTGMPAELTMVESGGQSTKGGLFDVSMGGCGVLVPAGSRIETNGRYTCFLQFKGERRITCEMEVRYIRPDKEQPDKRRIGMQFRNMDKKDLKIIEKICLSLDRDFVQRIFDAAKN
jgi:c-di-GMP-binding flagellar brake protein YcgR